MQQLLERDFTRSITALNKSLDGAKSLAEILRIYVTRNYDQWDEENIIENIIDILLAETEIASAIEKQRTDNARHREKLLINTISESLNISRKKAAMIALMASAASTAAGKFAHDRKMGRKEAIQTAIEFVTAGFESQASTKD